MAGKTGLNAAVPELLEADCQANTDENFARLANALSDALDRLDALDQSEPGGG